MNLCETVVPLNGPNVLYLPPTRTHLAAPHDDQSMHAGLGGQEALRPQTSGLVQCGTVLLFMTQAVSVQCGVLVTTPVSTDH